MVLENSRTFSAVYIENPRDEVDTVGLEVLSSALVYNLPRERRGIAGSAEWAKITTTFWESRKARRTTI